MAFNVAYAAAMNRYRTNISFAVLVMLFFAGSAHAAEDTPTKIQALESRILGILDEYNTPGMIGAIVSGDKNKGYEIVWQGALGPADGSPGSLLLF
jgi:hypothetical protein